MKWWLAICLLVACGKPVQQVRIGYQKSGSPFLLKSRAQALESALRAQGAEPLWVEFAAGPPILEAMRADGVDIGFVGDAPPVFAQAGGVPFVYVASDPPKPRGEAILVHADSAIRTLSDLRGKTIALNRGSNVHYLLLAALARAGLSLDDVRLAFLAPGDGRSAFESHSVDAWVIWDPFFAAAELAGARVLQDGEGLVDNRHFYLARREFAEQKPALLQTVLAEFAALDDWARAHTEDTAKLLAAASGVAYEALLVAQRRHHYGLTAITPEVIASQQRIADAFVAAKAIPQALRIQDATLPILLATRKPEGR